MSTERANGTALRSVTLPGGEEIPVLGVGTWGLAERPGHRPEEIAALQKAVDLGMTVIDTAEMYAGGAAEALIAEALGHRPREIFLVSKVLPQHATRRGTVSACEASLRRMNTDHLDLYLLHWRGTVPLDETLAAFEGARAPGKNTALGGQQLRRRRHGGGRLADAERRRERREQPGALQPDAPGHRIRSASLVPEAAYCDHGLLAHRTRASCE